MKTEKEQEPAVEGLVWGIWRLWVSDAEKRVRESDTFIAESVYFVLNSLVDWEPVEKLKQKSDVVNIMPFSVWD